MSDHCVASKTVLQVTEISCTAEIDKRPLNICLKEPEDTLQTKSLRGCRQMLSNIARRGMVGEHENILLQKNFSYTFMVSE